MPHLSLFLLGTFQAVVDGETVVSFGYDKVRALLAYISLESRFPCRRENLAALFWPDQASKAARHSLSQAVLKLRQALGDQDAETPFLLVDRQAIQLNPQSDYTVDVLQFSAALDDGEVHAHVSLEACPQCIQKLKAAVNLYSGDFLHGLIVGDSIAFENWLVARRERLRLRMLNALHVLTHYHARRGEYTLAQKYAHRQVELAPYREDAHRELMRIFARSGQRSAALVQYQICRRILEEEVGVEPAGETQALYRRIRSAGEDAPHNLPASLSPLIGRAAESRFISENLANPACRLLTIVGIGGVGKTRLALEAAREQIGVYPHGVYFVPLAPVTSAEYLASAIAESIQAPLKGRQPPEDELLAYIQDREMLLVLDNFEHLIESSGWIRKLLQGAPHVDILVTSQEMLNLEGEICLTLQGLSFPEEGVYPQAVAAPAVRFFANCARRIQMDFEVTPARLLQIIRICHLTQGVPLALEMAAAWIKMHSCEQIAAEIAADLDYLVSARRDLPERQRSVRAVFDHTWALLSPAERETARRLAVFRDEFTLSAARAIVGSLHLNALQALVDKSILSHVQVDRYSIHPSLKQYLLEKLAETPQIEAKVRLAHSGYFTEYLHRQGLLLKERDQQQAILADIEVVIGDIRAAWDWAVEVGDFKALDQAVGALFLYFEVRSRFHEGVQAFEQAIAKLDTGACPDRIPPDVFSLFCGKILARLGRLYVYLGEYERASDALKRSHAFLEDFTERLGLSERASTLGYLGIIAHMRGEFELAREYGEQGLLLSRQCGDREGIGFCLNLLGNLAQASGDYAQARRYLEENLAIRDELGDAFGAAVARNNLGNIAQAQGALADARRYYQACHADFKALNHSLGMAAALTNAGYVAWKMGAYVEARQLHLESLEIKRQIGNQGSTANTLANLGEVACSMEDYPAARDYFREALSLAVEAQAVPLMLEILIGVAVLLLAEGGAEKAVEFLTLAATHPGAKRETQERAEARLHDAATILSPERVAQIRQQARALSLDGVVAEIFE